MELPQVFIDLLRIINVSGNLMTTYPIDKYYDILGVTDKATIGDIKRAYRTKAKILHPDKNKSPDAHEQFILLTEAYEFLINLKAGKTKVKQPTVSYADWQRQSRDKVRERARQYAQMQYKEFKKTDYYKKSEAAGVVFEHLYFFSAVLTVLSPLWGYFIHGIAGFFIGVLFTFMTVHYWADIFKEKSNINLKSFFQSTIIVVKTKTFHYLILSLINLYLFFNYTLNTQLTFLTIGLILLTLYALTYFAVQNKSSILNFSKTFVFLCIIPTTFNLFFLTNFIFSSNPTVETYSFVHEKRWYGGRHSRGRLEKIAYIDLENNKYQDYHWFRMFYDFPAMANKSEITYKFEDGLFGLRVLTTYEFTK